MLFAAVHESAYGTKPTSRAVRFHVRYRGQSGQRRLVLSISPFDPKRTSGVGRRPIEPTCPQPKNRYRRMGGE
jgi:hypothetical protein